MACLVHSRVVNTLRDIGLATIEGILVLFAGISLLLIREIEEALLRRFLRLFTLPLSKQVLGG